VIFNYEFLIKKTEKKMTRNISEFNFLNEKIIKILIEEGIVDETDGEIYSKKIELTRDSLESFKNNCESYSSCESQEFEGQKISILRNFQLKKGDVRKSLFLIKNNNDDEQNLVLI